MNGPSPPNFYSPIPAAIGGSLLGGALGAGSALFAKKEKGKKALKRALLGSLLGAGAGYGGGWLGQDYMYRKSIADLTANREALAEARDVFKSRHEVALDRMEKENPGSKQRYYREHPEALVRDRNRLAAAYNYMNEPRGLARNPDYSAGYRFWHRWLPEVSSNYFPALYEDWMATPAKWTGRQISRPFKWVGRAFQTSTEEAINKARLEQYNRNFAQRNAAAPS